MKAKPFSVIVERQFPNLAGVFDKGDKVTCYAVLHDEDVVTTHTYKYAADINGNRVEVRYDWRQGRNIPDPKKFHEWKEKTETTVHATKGTFKDLIIVNKEGRDFNGSMIVNLIGYIDPKDWLTKLPTA